MVSDNCLPSRGGSHFNLSAVAYASCSEDSARPASCEFMSRRGEIRSETAAQLFARLSARQFGTFGIAVFLEDEVSHGSLVELCGEDGTGKSALLHHMAVQCVLPKQVPGGGGGEVAFVTTNCSVNVHLMMSMLTKRLQMQGLDVQTLLHGCLQRVHVLHCHSSSQLLSTLSKIKRLISDHPAINLVLIDDIGSFYWIDRYEWGTAGSMVYPDEVARPLCASIQDLLQSCHTAIVVAKASLLASRSDRYNTSRTASVPFQEPVDYMPLYWQKMVTHRILLTASDDKCGLRELEKRTVRVPLRTSRSTSIQYFPCPLDEGTTQPDGGKEDLLYKICTACNVTTNRHRMYRYVATDVGIINLH